MLDEGDELEGEGECAADPKVIGTSARDRYLLARREESRRLGILGVHSSKTGSSKMGTSEICERSDGTFFDRSETFESDLSSDIGILCP